MTVTIPVRPGPFQYVLVRSDGTRSTVDVEREGIERGSVFVEVGTGDRVLEIALASTSDPDLDRAKGQLWP
jgi:hypothetical protein